MDPALKEAAKTGDVNFLLEAISHQRSDYFLAQSPNVGESHDFGNIFHLAAWRGQADFFRVAMDRLSWPKELTKILLFQKAVDIDWTPLHSAAVKGGNHEIIKLIIQYYTSLLSTGDGVEKPWLALTRSKKTPLNVALEYNNENEKGAMQILLMDVELLSTMVDEHGTGPLFLALQKGFTLVAETILMSSAPLSSIVFSGKDGSTSIHFAPNCSENVLRLLLKNCTDSIDKIDNRGFSVLHQWAEIGEAWPCKLLLESNDFPEARTKIFRDLVRSRDNNGSTPLHIAARNKKASELGQILVRGYQQVMENQELVSGECPPWNIKDIAGITPLHVALSTSSKLEELALEIMSIDPTSREIRNDLGHSPFFLAILSGCERYVEEFLRIGEPSFDMLRSNDGTNVLQLLTWCSEGFGKWLLEKYWWMINLTDHSGKTALDYAIQNNAPSLVIRLLKNPSLIEKKKFDWVEACKRKETQAVRAFIDNCEDLQRVYHEENDTPLHHIQLSTYEECRNFLKIPSIGEFKNTTDHEGETPLHRALERKDMLLAKALLLDVEVERIIRDDNGTTAMDLLAKLYNENDTWEKMCKQIKVNPNLRTSYIQPGTNLGQMRSTLSVVAALLATITFAAGFTLPGGFKSTGEAVLAKKAAFLVFLLADVYAMCTSMLVLFCLMWSMVSEPDMSRLLVDRSVFILMQSLYSTLLAFMTGIFTVISHSSLWAAILIFVMCSFIGVSVNRTTLRHVVAKLIPAAKTNNRDRMRLLEEGNAGASSTEKEISRTE